MHFRDPSHRPARHAASAAGERRSRRSTRLGWLGLLALLGVAGIAVAWHASTPPLPWAPADLTASLLQHRDAVLHAEARRPWIFLAGFLLLFTFLSAFAVPGCSVLGLVAGLCWGGAWGAVLMSAAATLGATVAFMASRHLARDPVQAWVARQRWAHRWQQLDALVHHHPWQAALALLSLRLAPVVPYPMVNPLMGLGPMPWRTFAGVSFLGMLPGSAAYTWAGAVLSPSATRPWTDPSAWVGPLSLVLLVVAVLPWLGWHLWRRAAAASGRQASAT